MYANYRFELEACVFGFQKMTLIVNVDYDVAIGWEPSDRQPFIEKLTPLDVEVTVGGNPFCSDPWKSVVGELREYIIESSKTLSFEALQITDDEARQELAEINDQEAFEYEHRAGAI